MPGRRRYALFLLLIAPAVVLRLVTSLYPVVHTAYLSLFDVNLIMGRHDFAGWWNYVDLRYDRAITGSISFTVLFVAASTVLQLVLGFGVALLLNAPFRGRWLVRTTNLIPWAIPTIVAAIGFRWLLDDQYGMLIDLWSRIFLAGLQSVPAEVYEAARIDGAGRLQSLRYITIPFCASLVTTVGVFFVIWQLASFDLIYGMTQGGPGVATSVISYRIFQLGFLWFNYGMASALSMVLFALVAVVGVLGLALVKRQQVSL